MFKFIKKIFQKKPSPTAVKIILTEEVDTATCLSFDLVLGFDLNVDAVNSAINLKVNRLSFLSNNESAKAYIESVTSEMVKSTISILCLGASDHILSTKKEFVKRVSSAKDIPPADPVLPDRNQLN